MEIGSVEQTSNFDQSIRTSSIWDVCWKYFGIGFDVAIPSGGSLSNFEIELKSTTQIALSAWSNNNLQTCFGPTTVNDVTGWNQTIFIRHFTGMVSNIIVQTCFYSSSN